ncbi:PaaX family transcriptional regulator [Rhizocola hellebori]|uniref:PaaX family transcriptional regulator n=1 Tax=Rhizocola hellebori TaxID=1392758 RepID=A0A8J3Q429_9ACTN|nr:PaaX family transcriptional regulator C-terminal domain-containing protein [Rhizocola hellebori]GIH03064.1 PaaX family transcriptional regulator [Rhizocola hellebori]
MRSRQPRQLLFAFLGEHVLDDDPGPIRASVLLNVLEGAGIAAPATRATLDRLVTSGFLERSRSGREILFALTEHGTAVLREAAGRVRSSHPFDPVGSGWTLVTFSVPEEQRTLRHHLRSTLTWAGFAPLRDGLWLAPGEVDLASALQPLREELPPNAVLAFHARELPGYPVAESVKAAWDIEAIRGEHLSFIKTWTRSPSLNAGTALSLRAMLVADWLALLRVDPRLPREFMDPKWPASRSYETYRRVHDAVAADAEAEFRALLAQKPGGAPPPARSAATPRQDGTRAGRATR